MSTFIEICEYYTLENVINFDIIYLRNLLKDGEKMRIETNKDKIKRIIRHNIIAYRNKNGLTQVEVAKALGLNDYSTYRSWESGRCIPPHFRLAELADIYGIGIEKFYEDYIIEPGTLEVAAPMEQEKEKETYGDNFLSELERNEKILIMLYRSLNQKDKKTIKEQIDILLRGR